MTELYNLKHGDKFKLTDTNLKMPVCSPEPDYGKLYWFGHIDGMYSYCKDGDEVVHFAAWTEVEKVNDEA